MCATQSGNCIELRRTLHRPKRGLHPAASALALGEVVPALAALATLHLVAGFSPRFPTVLAIARMEVLVLVF
jgi:hypothetical protein